MGNVDKERRRALLRRGILALVSGLVGTTLGSYLSSQREAELVGKLKHELNVGQGVIQTLTGQLSQAKQRIETLERDASSKGSKISELEEKLHDVEKLPEPSEPKTIESKVKVAAYYITGWGTSKGKSSDWSLGSSYYPLLGNYRSDSPYIANWHIKWALEHGIDTLVPVITRPKSGWGKSLEEGLMKAKYFEKVNFAIAFNNEPFWPGNPYGNDPSYLDQLSVETMSYVAQTYFPRANYLKFGGRPVFLIYHHSIYADRLGPERAQRLATDLRRIAKEYGYDVYLAVDMMSIRHDDKYNDQISKDIDGITSYVILNAGQQFQRDSRGNPYLVYPYAQFVDGYLKETAFWSDYARRKGKGFIPPVNPGYSNRTMYLKGIDNFLADTEDVSPQLFRKMCENSKRYVDLNLNMVLVEAWNEFHESSVIEPTAENGFSYLQAVRNAFATGEWPPIALPYRI